MSSRKPGRPAGGETVSKEVILSKGLALLGEEGVDGMTMRALATRAGINPMTIYHHFGDRDGLIRALADLVYAEVETPAEGNPLTRVRDLLLAYHSRVVLYPSLTLAIFVRASLFPDQARRITNELIVLLETCGLSSERAQTWAYVLVDYTHGAALAAAVQPVNVRGKLPDEKEFSHFETGLTELLDALERALRSRTP